MVSFRGCVGGRQLFPPEVLTNRFGAAPDRHVHWSSRGNWYVHGDELLVQE